MMRIPITVDFLGSQSVVPSQERMIKFHVVPSFLNPDPLATDPFSVSVSYRLLVSLFFFFCVLSIWLGNHRVGNTQIRPDRNAGCTPFAAGVLPFVPSSQGNCLRLLLLSSVMALDLGRLVSFAPFGGILLTAKVLFSTASNIYCLYQLKPGKIFESVCFYCFLLKHLNGQNLIWERLWAGGEGDDRG